MPNPLSGKCSQTDLRIIQSFRWKFEGASIWRIREPLK